MNAQELTLARAASQLTPGDLKYLDENGFLSKEPAGSRVTITQEAGEKAEESASPGGKKRKRRKASHEWPEVGTILEADYYGVRYESEVIAAPQYHNGKAVRILVGPAAGQVCRSLSGGMAEATERQREEHGLNKKGIANGWTFWKVKTITSA